MRPESNMAFLCGSISEAFSFLWRYCRFIMHGIFLDFGKTRFLE